MGSYQDSLIAQFKYCAFIIKKYRLLVGGLTVFTALAAFLYAKSLPAVFSAKATLLIESSEADLVSIDAVYGLDSANDQYFRTQYEILKSRQLVRNTLHDLDLLKDPSFWQPMGWKSQWPANMFFEPLPLNDEAKLHIATGRFSKALTVSPIRSTQLVRIGFESTDRDLVAQVANAHAQQYIQSGLSSKLEASLTASDWIGERLATLNSDLQAAELRLQEFKEDNNVAGIDGGVILINNELENVSRNILAAREKRLELGSLYRQVQAIDLTNPDELELIPSVLQSNLLRDIKASLLDVRRRKAELSKRYLHKHPRMIAVTNELNDLVVTYKKQVSSVVNALEKDYRIAQENERSLELSMQDVKARFQSVTRVDSELNALEQDLNSKRTVYDAFLKRHNEISATSDLKSAAARVINPAVRPLVPSKPNKKLIVLTATLSSFFLAFIACFIREKNTLTAQSPDDIASALNQETVGIVPYLALKRGETAFRRYVDKTSNTFSESIKSIRTNILLTFDARSTHVLAITSTEPSEGKTTLSCALATALSEMQKTILIDTDMRRPSVSKVLGLEDQQSLGLADILQNKCDIDDAITKSGYSNLDVITAGHISNNPIELIGSEHFELLLNALKAKYTYIICDTAPVGIVSDATMLSRHVDSMLYVIRADRAPLTAIESNLTKLDNLGVPIAGVILNQFDAKKSNYGSTTYGKYYKYSDAYR